VGAVEQSIEDGEVIPASLLKIAGQCL